MARQRSSGDLYHRFAFDRRIKSDDGYGNTVSDWQEAFQVRAGVTHIRGGEAVMAGRLEGQHTQVVFVRASSETRGVTTDWRARNVRTGETFNIRDITPTTDRLWIDFLCQSGVTNG